MMTIYLQTIYSILMAFTAVGIPYIIKLPSSGRPTFTLFLFCDVTCIERSRGCWFYI